MRLTFNSPSFMSQILDDGRQPERHARHAQVVELLGRVAREMVVRIPVVRGIRDHDGREAGDAERPVVGALYALDDGGCGEPLGRKLGVAAEGADRAAHECARAYVADESDEIAAI